MDLNELREIVNTDISEKIYQAKNEFTTREEIALFGAGVVGDLVSRSLKYWGKRVNFFSDNSKTKWGQTVNDITIISPTEFYECPKDTFIIISTGYVSEIEAQLKEHGFKNIYPFNLFFSDFFTPTNKENTKNALGKIEKTYNLWHDEKSKIIFKNILKYRNTAEVSFLSETKEDLQYFDLKIIKLKNDEIFIDGGAFDGQTSIQFKTLTKDKFKKIYLFEPGQQNVALIKKTAAISRDERIVLINKGLYAKEDIMNFNEDAVSSTISTYGKTQVEVERLDNLIEEKVTFIKMDIEGAEIAALHGACHIIKKYQPKLAISVYHKYDDLWEIPLLLKEFNPDYKLYLRNYRENGDEIVCYAVMD